MTKDQEANPLKTLQDIELILDPAPSPGGDVVWLLNNALTNLKEDNARLREVASWAQSVLTALNVGDVASGSRLHLKLREVMIASRAQPGEVRKP
jgi:hypothetical protein